MENKCWLPRLEFLEDYGNNWNTYEDAIYKIFKCDFVTSPPTFNNLKVNIRKHPVEFGKEETFFHVTSQDYQKDGKRVPDLRRCERIRWIRAFIENYLCDSTKCEDCSGIKLWNEPYKNTFRTHLLFEKERYIVVIEKRDNYYLLITAFYIEYDHTLNKKLKKYEQYK